MDSALRSGSLIILLDPKYMMPSGTSTLRCTHMCASRHTHTHTHQASLLGPAASKDSPWDHSQRVGSQTSLGMCRPTWKPWGSGAGAFFPRSHLSAWCRTPSRQAEAKFWAKRNRGNLARGLGGALSEPSLSSLEPLEILGV